VLLAILASPPLTTSGDRTRARLHLAAELLGYDQVELANLLSSATSTVLEISVVGASAEPWDRARPDIDGALERATGVLLGWGCSEPNGLARLHHRRQTAWLAVRTAAHDLPRWTIGGAPRHPSRWQRYTHRTFPGVEFRDAVRRALCPPDYGS
jgi:hypothetical protein